MRMHQYKDFATDRGSDRYRIDIAGRIHKLASSTLGTLGIGGHLSRRTKLLIYKITVQQHITYRSTIIYLLKETEISRLKKKKKNRIRP